MRKRVFVVAAAALAVLAAGDARAEQSPPLLGADETTLQREPQVRPALLGTDRIDGLRFPDAADQITMIDPPQPDNHGDATLEYPLEIPGGRAGFQPDLKLTYDSGAGAGWLGTGWDLGVGEIVVDTRWGVPRYDRDKETETYLLDGDELAPTAVRSEFQPRPDGDAGFTRRVETEHELIVRHGTDPTNYWWEVHDKLGGVRWYGGKPDDGGPFERHDTNPEGLDENAVVRTHTGGPIYRWALTAQRDSYVNLVRYEYEKAENVPVGDKDIGTHLYLKRIRYTEALPDSGERPDPAYEIRFLRDGDARKDIVVDAKGGYVDVTRDLLRKVEVWTGKPKEDGSLRDFDTLARAWKLNYHTGAFGKALLSSVEQVDADGDTFATQRMDYFDDVRDGDDYDGFENADDLTTHSNNLAVTLLNPFGVSALGASDNTGADAHLYLGFGLFPTKLVSVGGSVSINGGYGQSLLDLIDINGDGLPDKVFKAGLNKVGYRLNRARPGGTNSFGEDDEVGGLDTLDTNWELGVAGGFEGYIGANLSFSVQGSVNVGEAYFEDVNDDGLPDFVNGGKVYFNHLDDEGVPHFSGDSSQTKVPIATGDVDLDAVEKIGEVEQQLRDLSPLLDTVRRWVAPYTGVVTIDAPVALDPPPDTRLPKPPGYDGDGVRVAIQRGGEELWAAALAHPGDSATPSGVGAVAVERGQAIYFRVGSVDHGALDQVRWNPHIRYVEHAGPDDPPTDVNGRDQLEFRAAQDFTLAGRPVAELRMPAGGTVHLDAVVRKTKVTSDDVRVLVKRNGVPVVDHVIDDQEVYPDGLNVSTDFDVTAPADTDGDGEADAIDVVTVELHIDTPVDLGALEWAPHIYYTHAVNSAGEEIPVFKPDGTRSLDIPVPVAINVYPPRDQHEPVRPWESPIDGEHPVGVRFVHSDDDRFEPGPVTVAIKQRNRLIRKQTFMVPAVPGTSVTDVVVDDVPFEEDEDYWFEIAIERPDTNEAIRQAFVRWIARPPADENDVVLTAPAAVYGGPQGIFAPAFRGWGYAGYDGTGERATQPIDEEAFRTDSDEDDFPDDDDPGDNPDGFQGDPTHYSEPDLQASRTRSVAFVPFELQLLDEQRKVTGTAPVWRGPKDNTVGGAGFARASRKGVDDPDVVPQPGEGFDVGGGSARGVRKVGVAAPAFALGAGFMVAQAKLVGGNSFGLLDFTDFNGDDFPDIVAPGYVKYTGPRGGFVGNGPGVDTVSQDTTVGVGAGFGGATGKITADPEGDTNTAQNTASDSTDTGGGGGADTASGDSISDEQFGFSLGASFGVDASFTNPPNVIPGIGDALEEIGMGDISLEKEYADMNGDGLPDEIHGGLDGVEVRLNLGYGNFSDEIQWADDGGFEVGESYSGNLGGNLGVSINSFEIAAGAEYTEGVEFPHFQWGDVDGDGILDRMEKQGTEIRVRFGTGDGLGPEVDYGDFQQGSIDLAGDIAGGAGIPTGEQIAQSRGRGFGGGVDFTAPAGPLCTPTPLCYILINVGAHVDHSVTNSVVQLTDVNGDGYPDSVSSNADDAIQVKLNQRGRTNLLRSVKNPLGGELRLNYRRQGNTTDEPHSQWALASVEVDDKRDGDGPNVLLSTYEYEGAKYNPLEREELGYSRVTETQRAFQGGADLNVFDDPVLRVYDRRYHNESVFDSGLVTSEKLLTPGGRPVKETRTEWRLADAGTGEEVDVTPTGGDPAGVRLLGVAAAPERTKLEQRWYDDEGDLAERTWNAFEYDRLGNVVRQVDVGEPETTADDLIATTEYSNCALSASGDLKAELPCGPGTPAPPGRPSELWSADYCPTWTSLPARFEIRDGAGELLRGRDGAPGICDNGGVTALAEQAGDGQVARTDLGYDAWGNYAHIEYPADHGGRRLTVDYVFDDNQHASIASTVEQRTGAPLEATATYDPVSGLITSRTDPNGQTTSYSYDAAWRLKSVTAPDQQDSGHATIEYDYHPTDPRYAYATARHFDAFRDDPIETASFLDGSGRETQTKQDGTVFQGADSAPRDVMVVAGAVEFDALGRPVKEWYPTWEPTGRIDEYKYSVADPDHPTVTTYNVADRVTKVQHPDTTETKFTYGFGGEAELGATVFDVLVHDRNDKPQRMFVDARDRLLAVHDGSPALRTRYGYDALGQLVRAVENGGATTTHAYDLLGRRTASDTADGGLTERRFDPAGNLVAKVTPKLRTAGQQIGYEYDRDRLLRVDYPDGTPDTVYEYGDAGAPDGGAGRVVRVQDAARDQRFTYNRRGDVATDTSTMLVHNLNDAVGERVTYATRFSYDVFGRLRELTYPDREVVRHDYDAGGLLRAVSGEKAGHEYRYVDRLEYDEFLARRLLQTGTGVRSEYAYDVDTRRLTSLRTTAPGKEIQDLSYAYDNEGNVEGVVDDVPMQFGGIDPILGGSGTTYGGPVSQSFQYDPYYRLTGAQGTYRYAPTKRREYTLALSYDAHGNTASKAQTDLVFTGSGAGKPQATTTYDLGTIGYRPERPHQLAMAGRRAYSYDANGNLAGWADTKTGARRTVTWDAGDRMASVADQGSTTDYTYDGEDQLAIERGPSGETVFVNPWYTVRNGTERRKQIWAGEERLATQFVYDDGTREDKLYFDHKDLQGNANVVTGDAGLVFQHLELFPFGETWVREQSTEYRTPYQFAAGYAEEVRGLTNLGARWYEPRDQAFYAPDPVLADDPKEAVDDPALLPAYTYAQSNPLRLVDRGGRAPGPVGTTLRAAIALALRPTEAGALQAQIRQEAAAGTVAAWAAARAAAAQGGGSDARAAADRAGSAQPGPDDTGAGAFAPHGSSPVNLAPDTDAAGTEKRASRLWGTREESIRTGKSIKSFAERFEAKPLVQIDLVKGKDGIKLKAFKLSPGVLGQKTFTPKAKTPTAVSKPEIDHSSQGAHADPPAPAGAS